MECGESYATMAGVTSMLTYSADNKDMMEP